MLTITDSAQNHFRRLLEQQGIDGLGIRIKAVHPGTPKADCQLEFCEAADLAGDEWEVACDGFNIYVDAASVPYLDGAELDYQTTATGGQLTIRAPKIKGQRAGRGCQSGRARALSAGQRDQSADRLTWRPRQPGRRHGRRRGRAAFWRRLPRLRHGRRDAEAGHRTHAAHASCRRLRRCATSPITPRPNIRIIAGTAAPAQCAE